MRRPISSGDGQSCRGGGRCLHSGTPAAHCLTARGQWAVQFLQCSASLPWGSDQFNSCNALRHRVGAVGNGTRAMQCLTS